MRLIHYAKYSKPIKTIAVYATGGSNQREGIMLKRNIKITFRLNESEKNKLTKYVKKSGLSQEAYLRHLINNLVPTDLPPPDYHRMMNELRGIGKNINQIAQKAHVLNVIDAKRFDEAYAQYKETIITIVEAVMLPRKVESWLPRQSGR